MNQDEKYMQRCLELAAKGFGKTAQNPMVGCVIVHENKIIGEGFHKKFGEAHAEVIAIKMDAFAIVFNNPIPVGTISTSYYGKGVGLIEADQLQDTTRITAYAIQP